MKTIYLITFLLLLTISMFGQNQIIGKWLSEDKEAITEIYEHSGKFYGKIVWLKKPNDENGNILKDTENPDIKLRQRTISDLVIVNNLSYKNKEWVDGTVYDPKTGKTYDCKLWLTDNNTLNLRGYARFFHSTETWSRTKL